MKYTYILQWLFYKFMMFPKQNCGNRCGEEGGRPGICCPAFFALVTVMSTQTFYFKSRILGPASLSPSKTSFGGWGGAMGSRGERRGRERASPPSIIWYLNPVPLELREAGRKMPLPQTAAFTLCRPLAFYKRDNVQTWICPQKHKKRI